MQDMGELAARLGSPVVYDRRGEVLWYDTMDRGLSPYKTAGAGTGWSVKVRCQYSHYGSYVLTLTSGFEAGTYAMLYKHFGAINVGKAAVEIGFNVEQPAQRIEFRVLKSNDVIQKEAKIVVQPLTGILSYVDNEGAYHTIDTVGAIYDVIGVYHTLKIFIDFDLSQFTSVMFDQTEYDLTGVDLRVTLATFVTSYQITISIWGRTGHNDPMNLTHIIFTGNDV
jgi:hypothetical protein